MNAHPHRPAAGALAARAVATSVALFLAAFTEPCRAAPYPPDGLPVEWAQPDGTRLRLRVFGDEFHARTATEDDFTVIFDPATRAYYYARRGADGESLVASAIPASHPAPADLAPGLTESAAVIGKARAAMRKLMTPDAGEKWAEQVAAGRQRQPRSPTGPLASETLCLLIPVQFPDDPATGASDPVNFPTNLDKVTRYCNEIGYDDDGNSGSLRDYYTDQSNGLATVIHQVAPITTMPSPRNWYNYSDYPANTILRGSGEAGTTLVAHAIAALQAASFDFSGLTRDGEDRVIATSLFFAGPTSGVWAQGLWPHKFTVSPDINVGTMADPIYIHNYQMTDAGSPQLVIGTFLHELGHLVFDFPDLYDYGNDSSGLGGHCLMASGNWRNGGMTPAPINLYLKSVWGWANLVDLAPGQDHLASLPSTGNHGRRIAKPGSPTEFFVIENRGPGDKWAASAPDQGIAIWHVDEAVYGNNDQQMTPSLHYQVSLEQADGEFDLEMNLGDDSSDLFDATTPYFNDGTTPDAFWWDGTPSGIAIKVLGPPAASIDVEFSDEIPLGLALDAPALPWTTGGNQPWTGQSGITHDGADAGMSGDLGDNQASWVETAISGSGVLRFWWKVSSEAGGDFLDFQLDGAPVPSLPAISGESGWRQVILNIPAGNHTCRWTYARNGGITGGDDIGSLDQVAFYAGLSADVWVSTLTDELDGSADPASGAGTSLREAIQYGPAGATIGFLPDLGGGTIALTGGSLTVGKNLVIDAPVASGGITISGAGLARVVDITAGVQVTLNDLAIENGAVTGNGAGIRNAGTLTLHRCALRNHSATADGGGIHDSGTLTLHECTFELNHAGDDGGGVFSSGVLSVDATSFSQNDCSGSGGALGATGSVSMADAVLTENDGGETGGAIFGDDANVTLTDCTVSGNDAHGPTGGGAIHADNNGMLTLTRCTVANNHSSFRAGGISNEGTLSLLACTLSGNTATGNGGAIEHIAGILTLTSCTLSGNSGDVGGAIDGDGTGTIRLYSTTVSGNHATDKGGGIEETTGTLLLENSIVAGNTAVNSGPDLKASSINTQAGVNLLSNTEGLGGSFAGIVASPALSTLGDHGGPTLTLHPLPGSPAIDTGGATLLTVDQRGLPRLAGVAVDIGSVEVQPSGVVTSTANTGPGSLRTSVLLLPAGATVTFDPSLDNSTIVLASPIAIDKNLNIDATARTGLVVSGGDASGLFTVNAGVTASITGLELRDGSTSSGGAIHNAGNLTLVNCDLFSNQADDGGAIFNLAGATLQLSGCDLAGNKAFVSGGGLFNAGTATLENTRVAENSSGDEEGSGGGIHSGGNLELTDSIVESNGGQVAGGIRSAGPLTLLRCLVMDNFAWDGSGGGVLQSGASGSIVASTFAGNSCLGSGGGLFHGNGSLVLSNCTLYGNTSDFEYGGGVFTMAESVIRSCTLTGNLAGEDGGGVYIDPAGQLTLENSIVAENEAFTSSPDVHGSLHAEAGVNLLGTTEGVAGGFSGIVGDPELAPPGDYGGPTPVRPPLPGSPVIEAAVLLPATPATDQLGHPRPNGPLPDIGAVEATAFANLGLDDNDLDGIPDIVEPALGLVVGVDDSAVDSDGDGSSDADEIGNMTDPQDATDYLRIVNFTPAPGFDPETNPAFTLGFPTFPGLEYSIEADQNLDYTGPDFSVLLAPFTATGYETEVEVTLRLGRDFVRVRRE